MKVGYLGPEGTFSEEAGKLYSKKLGISAQFFPYSTFHDLLSAADKGRISEAVVPIENSMEGTIGIVTDMLVKEVNLQIKQEVVLPVYHYLLAKKGTNFSDISDIISIPQVLDQCQNYLRAKMPKTKLHFSHSSAEAAKQVAALLDEKSKVFAAIGTEASARLYGLKVMASKINAKDNQTRFVVLAKKDHPPTGKDKTSIVFSIAKDRPGGLHDVLGIVARQNINLTKIESRPAKKALGDYYFFIDMRGHRKDKIIAEVLSTIGTKTSFLKILGSYPEAKYGKQITSA